MGWCQKNKNSDDGLLQEWAVKKPLCCSSWICSSEQREAPRSMPKATPHHTRTSGTEGMPWWHTFRLANCKVNKTGREAIRGALKHKWLLPLAFHLPKQAPVCCSAVPEQVRGLTARSTALLLIQSKEGLPAGMWSNHR